MRRPGGNPVNMLCFICMDISGIIKSVAIGISGARAKDHSAVLEEMTRALIASAGGDLADRAVCDLKTHESMEGSLAGTGSAIFHCITEGVEKPVMALAVSKKEIKDASGKGPARIFFLLVSPMKESGTHLQLLSRLEGLIHDSALRLSLFTAKDAEEAKKAVKMAEASSRSLYIPLSKEELFEELRTGEKGLSVQEAKARLALAGPNTLKKTVKGTLLRDFFHNLFLNLFAVLLWAGGLMAFIAGMPELGWAIFLVIVLNAIFSFWQEYKAEKAVEALKKLLPQKVKAVRDDTEMEIDAVGLVPGDVVRLSEGNSVPADGRLIKTEEMRVDNSALTGESRPVYKISEPLVSATGFLWTEMPNMVFAGTGVVSGRGTMVVTSTGMDTEIGRVAYFTQTIKAEKSPLQIELVRITKTVTMIAVALGVLFFFLGYAIAGLTFAESFIFAIGIIVANVPEGLMPTVSLALAMGVQRMAKKNAIVKKLSAVETLGCATVICTDKTGTLTSNKMSVTRMCIGDEALTVTGDGYGPTGDFLSQSGRLTPERLEEAGAKRLLTAMALCNNSNLHPPDSPQGEWKITGDPTEAALLTAAAKAGIDLENLKKEYPRTHHLPFERIRKRMTTIHEISDGGTVKKVAFVKGSPKEMIELSAFVYDGETKHPMTAAQKSEAMRQNDEMASMGLRVLAAGSTEVKEKASYAADEVERDLVFLGLVAMLDAPRPEVKAAIEECRSAGIRVIMVTGDYGLTARAIASQVGLGEDPLLITGAELSSMPHAALREALKKEEIIFARVAPNDKLRVVTALQDNGEVVAMTGDGVNDAPALKKADIGVAMGMRGSDVAKEAAEIILADDNFASIVNAVREGRAVYANIRKFVTYIFASNIPELVPFIAFVLFKIPLPLTVMQILAVDLGTDIMPALALGVEPPEKGIMLQRPRPKGQKLLDLKTLSKAYLFLGPIEATLCLIAFFGAYWFRGWTPGTDLADTGAIYAAATTMSFAGIVASQIGNVFACRTETASVWSVGIFSNRFVLISIAMEAALTLTLIYTPFLAEVFGFGPLGMKDLLLLSAFPVIMLAIAEGRKYLVRRFSRKDTPRPANN